MKKLAAGVCLVIATFWAGLAAAQTVFIQIEAHPSLSAARESAAEYATELEDVNGFRFTTGWYVIALGPYDLDTAVARLNRLKSARAIPADSYLVDRNAYSQQFFPPGADALAAPAISNPAAEPATETTTETATETAGTAGAQTTAAPAEPADPVIPEETRREALRSESRLSRQEKMDLQTALQWFGFYNGAIDAAFGPGTRNSMAAWQQSKGYEPTGVLTTRQRAELTGEYAAMLASLDLGTVRDERAGIEVTMPRALVAFDRYEPPFAHYTPVNDSGVTVLLISQMGDENALLGLYDIMQTLRIVPLEGQRSRSANRFTLTGENSKISSYTHAELDQGEIKGFTLIWPAGDDKRRDVVLKAMLDSFTPIRGVVLPDTMGDGALDQSLDLVSGLEIRRPERALSGFYINERGNVLTTARAVEGCARITLDDTHEARVIARDPALGLALLEPAEPLAPIEYARLRAGQPRLNSEVAVSGYTFGGALGAPTLTFGTLADVRGLNGEPTIKRLALNAGPGDPGGPVFDSTGSVLGMLLPPPDQGSRQLPDGVNFAADAQAIARFLSDNGLSPAASDGNGQMPPEALTRHATNLTVLVSCWAD